MPKPEKPIPSNAKTKIISILESLADGIDPASGEVFPGDSPYQNPDIVRALFHAVRMLNEKQPRAKKGGLPGTARPGLKRRTAS